MIQSTSSSFMSTRRSNHVTPAFAKSSDTGPKASLAAAFIARTSSRLLTSPEIPMAVPPFLLTSSATSSAAVLDDVRDDDRRSLVGQRQHEAPADPATAASDEGDLAQRSRSCMLRSEVVARARFTRTQGSRRSGPSTPLPGAG